MLTEAPVMPATLVTVFGGSGFLGTALVRSLLAHGLRVRAAVRHPENVHGLTDSASLAAIRVDIRDEAAVEAALDGARAAVNAVGLYVEHGAETFQSVHVDGARIVARCAARGGVQRLVHVSGIGADAASPSPYVRARAAGERVVEEHFPHASIVRPSVLFGPGDSFLSTVDRITRLSPVYPLFGSGDTRMQPVYVEDVAGAVVRLVADETPHATAIELGGPRAYRYREIVEAVLQYRRRRRLLLPIPFAVWTLQAKLLSLVPNPPLTVDQVVLMRDDNVVSEAAVTFENLGIIPADLVTLLPRCLGGDAIP